nr:enoyl-CoA hydratase [Oceanococcus sp. HetDA_MAG_MS8]
MSDQLPVRIDGSTAIVTITNPPANTWTLESLRALPGVLHKIAHNPQVRALIITGEGPKFFSAGADLKTFAEGGKLAGASMAQAFGAAFEALASCPLPTIAAINGYAMGGGLEAALACDMRIASDSAQMALPEASVGLLPCAGGTQWLAHLVGEGWAKRLILCGERIDAATAERIGLVEEVVDAESVLPAAQRLAAKVSKQSPDAVMASKRLIQAARAPAQAALPAEREAFLALFDRPNQAEGVTAFLEKRQPRWSKGA